MLVDSVIPLLLHRATNEKQFIRDLARTALDSALTTKEYESFAGVLLSYSSTEKNAQAVSVVRSVGVCSSLLSGCLQCATRYSGWHLHATVSSANG